jgi:hypothetical protein
MSNERSASIWRDFRRRDPAGAYPGPAVGPLPVQADDADEAEEAEEAEEADGVGEAKQDILVYQAPNEGTFLLRRCWFKVI